MKTGNRHVLLAAWLLAWVVSLNPASALADPAAAASPTATKTASTAMPSAPAVSMPKIASAAASDPSPEIKIPDLSKPLPGGKKDAKGDPADSKVPDSVKDVIKHLTNKTEDITLDDLNAAREAVAKLDALIDIEKRLADLDKIRNDRQKENDKKIADAIPKSALMPPPSYVLPAAPTEKTQEAKAPPPPKPMPVELDIIRVEGSNSHYGALVRDAGAVRLIHAGDHLSDGSVVVSVTTQGVELARDNVTHLTQVKDVQAVFGNSP